MNAAQNILNHNNMRGEGDVSPSLQTPNGVFRCPLCGGSRPRHPPAFAAQTKKEYRFERQFRDTI
jgi:hypothetical protein